MVIDSDATNHSSSAEPETSCFLGVCTELQTVFKLYGAAMSLAFLCCATALGLSVIFYGYLLVHPVAKTRAYVRNNVNLFPWVVTLMVSGMILVGFAVCLHAGAVFGQAVGAVVTSLGIAGLTLFFVTLFRMEYRSFVELDDYQQKRARKWLEVLPKDAQFNKNLTAWIDERKCQK